MAINTVANITSLNYPEFYPTHLSYNWVITSETDHNGTFIVTINDLHLESGYDVLRIGRGDWIIPNRTVAAISHLYFPRTISIVGPAMWIKFTSDHTVTERGFHLQVKRVYNNITGKVWLMRMRIYW